MVCAVEVIFDGKGHIGQDVFVASEDLRGSEIAEVFKKLVMLRPNVKNIIVSFVESRIVLDEKMMKMLFNSFVRIVKIIARQEIWLTNQILLNLRIIEILC